VRQTGRHRGGATTRDQDAHQGELVTAGEHQHRQRLGLHDVQTAKHRRGTE